MPLIEGKGNIGRNINEFRGGKTYQHTEAKSGKAGADKQALAVALKQDDKSKSPAEDHKAAIAKMHPEHLHQLVKDAHAGKFGPQAQQSAQQAMQPAAPGGAPGAPQDPNDPEQAAGQPAASPNFAQMFSGQGAGEPDQDDTAPVPAGQMFAGNRGGR